ncbi:DMT family transporter [Azospira restricta]|uniref:DMT family transporter n=1 Tax=Azospira restricta TaxID=404405 RepID=A0A974SPD9_9RHOO|nr:DMT family transporter [Azospira restricta]QRJ63984.1 DMT family transporter [Azospira restricta]
MTHANLCRLLALAAIWGASFLFMRVGAPAVGPAALIFLRVALAALFLVAVAAALTKPLQLARNWRHYLVLGLFNSALPFLLFAHAALTVSASLLSILNATAPIWGALLGAVVTRTRLSAKAAAGLLLGIAGVAVLAGVEAAALPAGGGRAIAAALGAALCYGIATTYARSTTAVDAFANAHGSMWAATVWVLPALWLAPLPTALPEAPVVAAIVALGIVCSGVAYLLYFRLIAEIGAMPTLTVTFLIPAFGVLWGHLFLGEAVGWHTLAGAVLVLAGTALATGFSPRAAFAARAAGAR